MMSVNNSNMDLTLALGYSDHTVQTKLNNDSGAGVNAGSGLHIFGAPDPLSELVWTPKKGLSLKRADNSLAKTKPFLLWNVAPSNEVLEPPEIIAFNSFSDEKDIGKGSTHAEVNGNVDTNQNKELQPKNEEKDISLLQNIEMTGEDESDENCVGNGEQAPKSPMQKESDKKVVVTVKEERSKRKVQSSTTCASLQKTELSGENDMENSITKEVSVLNEARPLRNISVPLKASSPTRIKISPRKRKGKGKALSDGDNSDSKTSSNEEGSDESVESCNGARMFPGSKNLENIEQPLFFRSKRVKKQMQGHGSSFLTWISNMVNGLSKPSQEKAPSLALALTQSSLGHEGNPYGISTVEKNHNLWSALAIPEIRILKDDISTGEYKDVLLDDKTIIEVSPTMCRPLEDEQIFTLNDKINTSASTNMEGVSTKSRIMSQNVALAREEVCKSTSAEKEVSGSLACSKAKLKDIPFYALNDDASIGFENSHNLNPIVPFPMFKSSGAMTCLFARRLDAFKHNIPPDAINEATLFCGRNGHDLRNCSEATESEQEEGTYNIIVNHIAGSREKFDIVTDSNKLVQNQESISVERTARSSDFPENIASDSGENVLKGTSVLPLSTIGSKETASVVPKGAFDAIRRLRLSRGDIIKWLDSNASLSLLDGFFLRLRLGRWEGALGGTRYYIARIAGSQRESAKHSKCISVSICGITCSVGSQYVSNHDFLEDELMAWWCKTTESGGQIPSEDELRLKVEKRMKLGF